MKRLALLFILLPLLAACAPNPMGSGPDAVVSDPHVSQSVQGEAEIQGPDVVVLGTTATYTVIDADGQPMTDLVWSVNDGTQNTQDLRESFTHKWASLGQFSLTATYFDAEGAHVVSKAINVIEDKPELACAVETVIVAPHDVAVGEPIIARVKIGNCLAKFVRNIRWYFTPDGMTFEGPSAHRTFLKEGMTTITVELWVDGKRYLILTKPIFTRGKPK